MNDSEKSMAASRRIRFLHDIEDQYLQALAPLAELEHRKLLAGCAKNHRFIAGQFRFHERDPANKFIRQGRLLLRS